MDHDRTNFLSISRQFLHFHCFFHVFSRFLDSFFALADQRGEDRESVTSVGFSTVEPPEPPELVLVVFSEISVVLVVSGSGGSRPADRPADFFFDFGIELLKRNRK